MATSAIAQGPSESSGSSPRSTAAMVSWVLSGLGVKKAFLFGLPIQLGISSPYVYSMTGIGFAGFLENRFRLCLLALYDQRGTYLSLLF